MSHEEVLFKYAKNLKLVERVADALSACMANQMYVATFTTKKGLDQFYKDVLSCEQE